MQLFIYIHSIYFDRIASKKCTNSTLILIRNYYMISMELLFFVQLFSHGWKCIVVKIILSVLFLLKLFYFCRADSYILHKTLN